MSQCVYIHCWICLWRSIRFHWSVHGNLGFTVWTDSWKLCILHVDEHLASVTADPPKQNLK